VGPYSDDHINVDVEGERLYRMPIRLAEAIAQVDLDELAAVKQDDPIRACELRPLALNAIDVDCGLPAQKSGFFQQYGPKASIAPRAPAAGVTAAAVVPHLIGCRD
jgi:hypothetical protein